MGANRRNSGAVSRWKFVRWFQHATCRGSRLDSAQGRLLEETDAPDGA